MIIWIILAITLGAVSTMLLFLIKFFERSKRLNKTEYQKHWQEKVLTCLKNADDYKLAIIEADKLMDKVFKEYNLRGQTMGERLVSAGKFLSNKDAVWQVHKLRNSLIHEVDVEINLDQTKRALVVFAQALRDLGAL